MSSLDFSPGRATKRSLAPASFHSRLYKNFVLQDSLLAANVNIKDVVVNLGGLSHRQLVPKDICDYYKDKLPADWVSLWREYGIGVLLNGRFQFCIPSDYTSIVENLFAGDRSLDPKKMHVVGFSAFGYLLLWHEEYKKCEVDLPYLRVKMPAFDIIQYPYFDKMTYEIQLLGRSETHLGLKTENDKYPSLFHHALAEVGGLGLGQVYGFKPPLALGGYPAVENIQRMDALVYFKYISQIRQAILMRWNERDELEFHRRTGPDISPDCSIT